MEMNTHKRWSIHMTLSSYFKKLKFASYSTTQFRDVLRIMLNIYRFAKIINRENWLTIFAKISFTNFWQGLKCASWMKFFITTKPCTEWKVSRYGVFSGPHFPVIGLNTEIYSSVQIRKNTEQKKTLYLDTFHAVMVNQTDIFDWLQN